MTGGLVVRGMSKAFVGGESVCAAASKHGEVTKIKPGTHGYHERMLTRDHR